MLMSYRDFVLPIPKGINVFVKDSAVLSDHVEIKLGRPAALHFRVRPTNSEHDSFLPHKIRIEVQVFGITRDVFVVRVSA